jgi:hypothetical protein
MCCAPGRRTCRRQRRVVDQNPSEIRDREAGRVLLLGGIRWRFEDELDLALPLSFGSVASLAAAAARRSGATLPVLSITTIRSFAEDMASNNEGDGRRENRDRQAERREPKGLSFDRQQVFALGDRKGGQASSRTA